MRNRQDIRRTITAMMAGVVLFCSIPAGAEEPDLDIADLIGADFVEEVVLEDEKSILGWAEDIEFHRANENSPVKCDHALCFWNMKMGLLDDDAVIHVAPPSKRVIVPEKTEAFIVPKGTLVRLNTGVWHLAALPVHAQLLHVMIILPERVYANDCTVCDYPEDRQVLIEI